MHDGCIKIKNHRLYLSKEAKTIKLIITKKTHPLYAQNGGFFSLKVWKIQMYRSRTVHCEKFTLFEQRTVRTVYIVRTVRTVHFLKIVEQGEQCEQVRTLFGGAWRWQRILFSRHISDSKMLWTKVLKIIVLRSNTTIPVDWFCMVIKKNQEFQKFWNFKWIIFSVIMSNIWVKEIWIGPIVHNIRVSCGQNFKICNLIVKTV